MLEGLGWLQFCLNILPSLVPKILTSIFVKKIVIVIHYKSLKSIPFNAFNF